MNNISHTEKRIAELLAKMREAMPEIKRQVAIYEKSLKKGGKPNPATTVISRNV